MTRTVRLLLAVVALATTAGLVTACQPPTGPRVLIFGDSLTVESKGSGDFASILSGYRVDWTGTMYMTSPCNGIALAKKVTYVPDVVIINYAGNSGSYKDNCMAGERGQALADRYRKDVQTLINRYRNGKTKIVIVGAPARKPTLAQSNLVFTTLQSLATSPANQVAFYDGGRLLTPNRDVPTRAATCLSPRETGSRCGTSQDPKKNYIRDAQLEHLCPTGGTINGACGMYSSGAVRLTLNFRDAIKTARLAVR
ncbi:hypothetical protein ACE2AJ_15125 [Aquihabitans daechungensis]|uniref:hypothetical protein n=1 Tax=Aquihabitans daechungensis TaxID=1052257 RepID=UPI003BA06824